jgi:mono/diheme cytochrome c family protein
MRLFVRTLGAIALLAAAGLAGLGWWLTSHQFSARATPSRLEAIAARQLRWLAMDPRARGRRNPEPMTAETLREARAHFADHCATCHANDGSGETATGAGLYPKTPDLRAAPTQSLTDGALFVIIENGVRFTGMPASSTGTPEGERDSWRLVHFIRHLPRLPPEERYEMERLNPRTFEEWQQEREAEEFLGADAEASTPDAQHDHAKGEH